MSFSTFSIAAVSAVISPQGVQAGDDCSILGQTEKMLCERKQKQNKKEATENNNFESSDAGYGSHDALCGERKTNCRVVFSDEGIKAGKLVIPAGRFAGWSVVDKSHRTCNAFGVCYRGLLQKESQEFTISYLDINGKKSKLLVSFVNGKAALDFQQEITAFTQLAKASSGLSAVKYLSPQEAAKDILTSSDPAFSGTVPFTAWVEAPSSTTNDGKSISRFYAPSLAKKLDENIFEVPYLNQIGSVTITSLGRFDCKRGLVTARVIHQSGLDTQVPKKWSVIEPITPGQISFTAAKQLCQ